MIVRSMIHAMHSTCFAPQRQCFVLVSALASAGSHAEGGVDRNFTFEVATTLAKDASSACKADGHSVSVVVVDRHGATIVSFQGEGAGDHKVTSAQQKAAAAVSPSALSLGAGISQPVRPVRLVHPGLILLSDGVQVRHRNKVVGGVAVAGAPPGAQNEECAVAAVTALNKRLN